MHVRVSMHRLHTGLWFFCLCRREIMQDDGGGGCSLHAHHTQWSELPVHHIGHKPSYWLPAAVWRRHLRVIVNLPTLIGKMRIISTTLSGDVHQRWCIKSAHNDGINPPKRHPLHLLYQWRCRDRYIVWKVAYGPTLSKNCKMWIWGRIFG